MDVTDRQRTGGKGKIGAPVDFNVPGGSHRTEPHEPPRQVASVLLLASASRKLGEGGPIDTWERSEASRSRGNQDSKGTSHGRLFDASSSDPVPCIVTLIVELTGSSVR